MKCGEKLLTKVFPFLQWEDSSLGGKEYHKGISIFIVASLLRNQVRP